MTRLIAGFPELVLALASAYISGADQPSLHHHRQNLSLVLFDKTPQLSNTIVNVPSKFRPRWKAVHVRYGSIHDSNGRCAAVKGGRNPLDCTGDELYNTDC